MRSIALFALVIAGCGLKQDRWVVRGPDITVEVLRMPYGIVVRGPNGREVLRSRDVLGRGEGLGSLGWTTGRLEWGIVATPGYTTMDPIFDPWRDEPEVTRVVEKSDSLEVTLADGTRVLHKVSQSTLRVEITRSDQPRAWEASFAAPPDEAFLGFGERFNSMDQRGRSPYSWSEEGGLAKGEASQPGPQNPWPNGETMSWYPIPFFLSTNGYGFWLDSYWRNQFDLASIESDFWRVWHIGPTLAYEVYVGASNDSRPWPLQVIDRFTARTGRPMIPPAWSFGPHRRFGRRSQVNGMPEANAMLAEGLALTGVDDNQHFLPSADDIPVAGELAQWVKQNDAIGIRTLGYYNPYFTADPDADIAPETQRGLQNGYFLKNKEGTPSEVWLISGRPVNVYTVDFTNPDATAFFQSQFLRALNIGYSGWMYDFGEYVLPDVLTKNGISGEEYHNRFPVEYQKAGYDALEAARPGDWFYFSRSGYTGSQQWAPMTWTGDPDASFGEAVGLPAHLRGSLNLGISGVAHVGTDIGGFKCQPPDSAALADGELLARWIALGAVQSNMHDEDACTGGGGGKATIWSAPEAKESWRRWAGLHTRLQPYMVSLAKEANATGAPLMRALYLEHPERGLAAVDDEFYFGPALLAAPVVTRGARSRSVTLPEGAYLEWATGRVARGEVTVDAPLAALPLFLRDGHLVPMLDESVLTLDENPHPGVIGPREVADVLDVVGFVTRATGRAGFTLADGSALRADWAGGAITSTLAVAANEAALRSCQSCWMQSPLPDGGTRVRISATGNLAAGPLTLSSTSARRIRWDLYLTD